MNTVEDRETVLGKSFKPVRDFFTRHGMPEPDLGIFFVARYALGLWGDFDDTLPGTKIGVSITETEDLSYHIQFHVVCPPVADEGRISQIRQKIYSLNEAHAKVPKALTATTRVLTTFLEPTGQFPEDDPDYLGRVDLIDEETRRSEHAVFIAKTFGQIKEGSSGLLKEVGKFEEAIYGLGEKTIEEQDRILQEAKSRLRGIIKPFLQALE
ncbi:hypothetical protein HYU94_02015 [Candidatus Daviesbacteria bacterium]|nr:hypothetical protein [Candidatus Daviesbacteria bacterium]